MAKIHYKRRDELEAEIKVLKLQIEMYQQQVKQYKTKDSKW